MACKKVEAEKGRLANTQHQCQPACSVAVCWAHILVHSPLTEEDLSLVVKTLRNIRLDGLFQHTSTFSAVQITASTYLLAEETLRIWATPGLILKAISNDSVFSAPFIFSLIDT